MKIPLSRLTGIALVLLLSACSSAPDTDAAGDSADVATLTTDTPAASASPAASAQERPLLRPDASSEEEDRYYDVYWTCLSDHGVPGYTKEADGSVATAPKPGAGQGRGDDDAAAVAACANLEPETPWQRSQRTDPHYADRLRDWITCIRSHGIDAFEEDGFLAFESLPSEDKMRFVDECEMKAFTV
ncbi:hypothetical protein [Catenuloplanes japonicus]|uniref:hypothetical protein n=1 Tax=Catenuloplanes japonicus TaxID=33876 RepID=UPI00052787EF|nr:hypothetical protein [Catenuloplanes japonicus]